VVKASRDFSRQFDVRNLVLADRNKVCPVNQDVRRLQQRIPQEAVRAEVLIFDVLALLFVGRDALEPPERRDHAEQQVQFGMLRNMRLDEQSRLLRIQPGRQEIRGDFDTALFHARGVGVIRCERVPVGDEKKAVILLLQAHPVLQGADVMSEVELAGWSHAAQNAAFCFFCDFAHPLRTQETRRNIFYKYLRRPKQQAQNSRREEYQRHQSNRADRIVRAQSRTR